MALLSQALHLGYLLSPHRAFQGHAAHTARWPAMLSPNGSSATCIADGVFHIPMPCFHGALLCFPHCPHSRTFTANSSIHGYIMSSYRDEIAEASTVEYSLWTMMSLLSR